MDYDIQEFSCRLCIVLDSLGYGEQQRSARKMLYETLDQCNQSGRSGFDQITVGSKGEGITNIFESDQDKLIVDDTAMCCEDFRYRDIKRRNVFVMENSYSPPGHTMLTPGRQVKIIDHIVFNAVLELEIGRVLSSSMFSMKVDEVIKNSLYGSNGILIQSRNGPASRVSQGPLHIDQVFALECHCPNTLKAWASRPRRHGWPSPDVIQEVSSLQAYVVATGCEGSFYEKHEWRICFNIGEKRLIESLTDIQIKVYILLKLIMKETFDPNLNKLTSFMMKNIVFWMSELNPQFLFTEQSLVQWVKYALRILLKSLELNRLPYYMMPKRNLFQGKLRGVSRSKLMKCIKRIILDGPKTYSKIERLQKCLWCLEIAPELLFSMAEKRNTAELLLIQLQTSNKRGVRVSSAANGDEEIEENTCEEERLWKQVNDLIWPGWRRHVAIGAFNNGELWRYIEAIFT